MEETVSSYRYPAASPTNAFSYAYGAAAQSRIRLIGIWIELKVVSRRTQRSLR